MSQFSIARGIAEKLLEHADRVDTRIALARAYHIVIIGSLIGGGIGVVFMVIRDQFNANRLDVFNGASKGAIIGILLGGAFGLSDVALRYMIYLYI